VTIAAAVAEVPCPLCRGDRVTTLLEDGGDHAIGEARLLACTSLDHGSFGRIVACERCGMRFRSPREDDETILSYYASVEDPVYLENEAARHVTFARALDRLERAVPVRGPLLDVGCYTGAFLDVAAARGWPASGVEPSEWAAAAARAKGHEVHCGTLSTAKLGAAPFALVTMWDALEHYTDPVRELRLARAVVRGGGYLALSTMNVDSPAVRLLGSRWPWYMRMHLSYFTPDTVERALRAAGWRVTTVDRYSHVVTWDYLLMKLGRYVPRTSRLLRALGRRVGAERRTVTVALGDFMTVYATTAPGEMPR
jgi:SAM-dependent methyltransferase